MQKLVIDLDDSLKKQLELMAVEKRTTLKGLITPLLEKLVTNGTKKKGEKYAVGR